MATRKSSRRAYVDRHGGQAPTVTSTALCDANRHEQCPGQLLSLLATGPCQCPCHGQRERGGVAA